MQLDLERPEHAYLLGFLMGDGHLAEGPGRKGRLQVELSAVDTDHLHALAALLPGSVVSGRRRTTNFSEQHVSGVLSCCRADVRSALKAAGLPAGRKDAVIAPPTAPYSERDFARGLIDADGSLGFTAAGRPFLSLVTTSPAIATWWCKVLLRETGAERSHAPNARDGARNVMVVSDPAARAAGWLYRDGDLALARKARRAREVREWVRPDGMRRRATPRVWTAQDDAVVLNASGTQAEKARLLGRTERSVNMRAWRLRQGLTSPPRSRLSDPAATLRG